MSIPPVASMPDPAEAADLNAIKQWLYGWLVPADLASIAAQAQSARQWMQSLRADGSWGDIDYADQTPGPWKTSEHLNRLMVLAKVYSTPAQELYQDSTLLARILAAFDFWLARDFQNPNWWHNRIGVPMLISYIMVLMEARLSAQQIDQGCSILRRSTFEGAAGANLTWLANNQLICGCLDRTAALVGTALGRAFDEIKIVEPGQEGIQADFSFHQHEAVLYSGGYGLALISDAARFVACAYGTRFAAPAERFELLMHYLLDGQQWMMRGVVFDYSTVGREITRPGKDGRAIVRALSDLAQLAGPRQAELAAFAARLNGDPAAPPLVGNRHFRMSDYMVHQRRGYAMSARMYSQRTFNTDGYINDEGRQTHHLADGATYIFRTGEEYRDIFPVWDWRRVPGITCEQHPQPLDPARLHTRGATSFVGGVSDGMYGVAAMDLRREELSARKAWFFFERECVCLGAGIISKTGDPVLTSVNQCLRKGDVTIADADSGARVVESGEYQLQAGAWAHHDGIGYLFPGIAPIIVRHGPQTGNWAAIGAGSPDPVTKDVFSVWIDHGQHVADGSYQYIVVPDCEPQELASRTALSAVEILVNNATLQAVRQIDTRLCGVVFYEPGKLTAGPGWTIGVDKPCLLLLQEYADGVQIAIANPENQPLTVFVDIDRALDGDNCIRLDANRTLVGFELPGGTDAGSSVVRRLKTSAAVKS